MPRWRQQTSLQKKGEDSGFLEKSISSWTWDPLLGEAGSPVHRRGGQPGGQRLGVLRVTEGGAGTCRPPPPQGTRGQGLLPRPQDPVRPLPAFANPMSHKNVPAPRLGPVFDSNHENMVNRF